MYSSRKSVYWIYEYMNLEKEKKSDEGKKSELGGDLEKTKKWIDVLKNLENVGENRMGINHHRL